MRHVWYDLEEDRLVLEVSDAHAGHPTALAGWEETLNESIITRFYSRSQMGTRFIYIGEF